jgi:hypothetical protein
MDTCDGAAVSEVHVPVVHVTRQVIAVKTPLIIRFETARDSHHLISPHL